MEDIPTGLPDSLRIGAQTYTVVGVPDLAAEDDRYGEWNGRRLTIGIDTGAHRGRQEKTLLHEALEAVNYEYQIKLSHDQIGQLECALYALLVDNPGVFTYQGRAGEGHVYSPAQVSQTVNTTQAGNALLDSMARTFSHCLEVAAGKNADYASDADPFANFRQAEAVGVPVERGIMVRLTDKFARLANLLEHEPATQDEPIVDSIEDSINYLAILRAWLEMQGT